MCNVSELKIHRRCKTPEEPSIIYLVWKGETLGICNKCWEKFPKDLEWGDSLKLTMEEILSDKSRGLEGATLTEYKYRGKEIEAKPEEEDE